MIGNSQCPHENGISDGYIPVQFSNESRLNDIRGYALGGSYGNGNLRSIDGSLLVKGDIFIEGDAVIQRELLVKSDGKYSIDTDKNESGSMSERLLRMEKFIEFLCEKFRIDINALDKEFEELKGRTDVDKRLDAIK